MIKATISSAAPESRDTPWRLPRSRGLVAAAALALGAAPGRAQESLAFARAVAPAPLELRTPFGMPGSPFLPGPFFQGAPRPPAPASEAVGRHSRGRLLNAAALPMEGPGFVKIQRGRGRHYGADEMIVALQGIGARYASLYPGAARLQIGDISGPRGGSVGRHGSHENGLDADIAMVAAAEEEQDPGREGFDEVFVRKGKVEARFDLERNWAFLRIAVESAGVGRIFLDRSIKKAFCARYGADPANEEILRKLRPQRRHGDHFHLRIDCPPEDRRCSPQAPPPPGSGC